LRKIFYFLTVKKMLNIKVSLSEPLYLTEKEEMKYSNSKISAVTGNGRREERPQRRPLERHQTASTEDGSGQASSNSQSTGKHDYYHVAVNKTTM
jgi:hypothetical protein